MSQDLLQFLSTYQLAEKDCNGAVSEVHLQEISRSCCKKWRLLPAHLEMKEVVVNDIDRINGDEQEKRHAFLKKWKTVKGSGATYKILIKALLAIEYREDAESVCKLLQKSLPQESAPVLASSEPATSGKLVHVVTHSKNRYVMRSASPRTFFCQWKFVILTRKLVISM